MPLETEEIETVQVPQTQPGQCLMATDVLIVPLECYLRHPLVLGIDCDDTRSLNETRTDIMTVSLFITHQPNAATRPSALSMFNFRVRASLRDCG